MTLEMPGAARAGE
jgi:hypothetical protein